MRALVIGAGAVGARAIRQLVEQPEVDAGRRGRRRSAPPGRGGGELRQPRRVERRGGLGDADVVVLAGPCGIARRRSAAPPPGRGPTGRVHERLDRGRPRPARPRRRGAGAAASPSWSAPRSRPATPACWRATPPGRSTRSPSCTSPAPAPAARPAPGSTTAPSPGQALDWRDGGWQRRAAGSGRELCWFPDPIGAEDCYRAELPDALLLVPAFPGVERVTARLAATRRDRFSAHLPMLRKPHPEGLVGAVRVEVRGRRAGRSEVLVLGALDRPAVAAGATAALAAALGRRRAGAGRRRRARRHRRSGALPRRAGRGRHQGGRVRGRRLTH